MNDFFDCGTGCKFSELRACDRLIRKCIDGISLPELNEGINDVFSPWFMKEKKEQVFTALNDFLTAVFAFKNEELLLDGCELLRCATQPFGTENKSYSAFAQLIWACLNNCSDEIILRLAGWYEHQANLVWTSAVDAFLIRSSLYVLLAFEKREAAKAYINEHSDDPWGCYTPSGILESAVDNRQEWFIELWLGMNRPMDCYTSAFFLSDEACMDYYIEMVRKYRSEAMFMSDSDIIAGENSRLSVMRELERSFGMNALNNAADFIGPVSELDFYELSMLQSCTAGFVSFIKNRLDDTVYLTVNDPAFLKTPVHSDFERDILEDVKVIYRLTAFYMKGMKRAVSGARLAAFLKEHDIELYPPDEGELLTVIVKYDHPKVINELIRQGSINCSNAEKVIGLATEYKALKVLSAMSENDIPDFSHGIIPKAEDFL